ncbi:MAG: TetR/AcrR family transcriptional regulator [Myxococcota bacterium]
MNSDSENRRPRGRPPVDDKRRKILDAALEAFARRGYHGVTMPELAAAAGLGAGTVYRTFTDKQDLVNHVFRDAKARLAAALGAPPTASDPRGSFLEAWGRLVAFARAEPLAFQFLELQDHTPYLDAESRQLELAVLMPLWLAGQGLAAGGALRELPVEVGIAMVWGSLVGLIKAERLGYLRLDDAAFTAAGEACWAALAKPT